MTYGLLFLCVVMSTIERRVSREGSVFHAVGIQRSQVTLCVPPSCAVGSSWTQAGSSDEIKPLLTKQAVIVGRPYTRIAVSRCGLLLPTG